MREQKRFDDYLNDVFNVNGETTSGEKCCLSPIARKLKERKACKAVEQYVSWLKKGSDASMTSDLGNSNPNIEFRSYSHSLAAAEGRHFSLPIENNTVTILYEIFKSCSYETKTRYFYLTKTESVETIKPDGMKYVTYFIDNPQTKGNAVVLLQFNKAANYVLISSGMLIGDEFIVSTKPTFFEFTPIVGTKLREESDFCFEELSDTEKDAFLNGVSDISEYSINPDSTSVIIDTETYQQVPRKVYFEDGEYRAKIQIKHGCNYFVFQMNSQDVGDILLSDFEIAKCYYHGYGDFPKDAIKAAEMFEQIGDAESLYELAHIWLDESHNDVESLQDGISYLEEVACQGHVAAKAELVYYLMKLLCMIPAAEQKMVIDKYHEQIKCAVDTELPGALFLAAYVYEKGMFADKDTDLAFSYYLRAAKADNDAAKARIGMAPIGDYQNEDECWNYFKNSVDTTGLAEYFMGWFLADDPDVIVVTEDILYFYELAANSGVIPAIRELAEVYMSGNDYIKADPAMAIMWYEKLSDIDDDTAVKLANYYLGGKGCVVGPESDAKALALLKRTVETYENGTAYNNLAWMYKKGRGCENPDYAQALILFEKAAELECASAFYHLGDIYEHGLSVEPDRKKAWAYYQKGAELGNQKCIDIVKRGFTQEYEAASNAQVLSVLTDIQGRTVRIEDKLDGIIEYIETDLSSVISSARKKVQSCPEDDEAAVADFIESTSTYINQTMASTDALVEQETEQLKSLFGKSWDLLLPVSKASLISAGVLWKSCARITKPGFDFSGVCISATSALEMELKHIFYSGFQAFLEMRYGTPTTEKSVQVFRDWPEILLSCSQYEFQKKKGNAPLAKGNYFTLGKLPYILGKPEKFSNDEKENLLRSRLLEYLGTIVIDKYSNDPIGAFYTAYDPNCFVNKCEFINNAYRIKAAHTDVIEREQADDCYHQVIGKVDALKYTSDVTGLIIELYDMLK